MARKPRPNLSDNLKGGFRSIRNGTGMNPFANHAHAKQAMEERLAREGVARQMGRVALPKSTYTEISRRAYREAQKQTGRDIQYDDRGVKVLVKNGYDRRHDQHTTDVILIDPDSRQEHLHIIFGEQGDVLHEKWTTNH